RRYLSRQGTRFANWHLVDARVHPADLMDAPVLWVSGSREIVLSQSEADAVKAFTDRGGLVVGNADGAREPFNVGFTKLGPSLAARPATSGAGGAPRQRSPGSPRSSPPPS